MEQFRELSRAIALGDFTGAAMILDLIARDEIVHEFGSDEPADIGHQIALGRSDAVSIRRRDGKTAILLAA